MITVYTSHAYMIQITRDTAPKNTCDNRCYLNFTFDGNFNDSSCTRATAEVMNGHVGFVDSPSGQAAVFDGSGYLDVSYIHMFIYSHVYYPYTIVVLSYIYIYIYIYILNNL